MRRGWQALPEGRKKASQAGAVAFLGSKPRSRERVRQKGAWLDFCPAFSQLAEVFPTGQDVRSIRRARVPKVDPFHLGPFLCIVQNGVGLLIGFANDHKFINHIVCHTPSRYEFVRHRYIVVLSLHPFGLGWFLGCHHFSDLGFAQGPRTGKISAWGVFVGWKTWCTSLSVMVGRFSNQKETVFP